MNRKRFQAIASLSVALILILDAGWQARAQDRQMSYPSMAPLDQYLMDRNAEIALARSAAPEAISRDADVLVLGRHGYETAIKGKNGFVCAVERAWMGQFEGDGADNFWNPKGRGPVCFNPPAARSILPITIKRTEMVLAGQSKAQIFEGMKAFVKQGLPPLEPGAMSFMMSKEQHLNDGSHPNWEAHLMFYTPVMDGSVWGVRSAPFSYNAASALQGSSGTDRRIHGFRGLVVGWNAGPSQAGVAMRTNVSGVFSRSSDL